MSYGAIPPKQGLYAPAHQHEACGVGFVAHIKGKQSHEIIQHGLTILERLHHRAHELCFIANSVSTKIVTDIVS